MRLRLQEPASPEPAPLAVVLARWLVLLRVDGKVSVGSRGRGSSLFSGCPCGMVRRCFLLALSCQAGVLRGTPCRADGRVRRRPLATSCRSRGGLGRPGVCQFCAGSVGLVCCPVLSSGGMREFAGAELVAVALRGDGVPPGGVEVVAAPPRRVQSMQVPRWGRGGRAVFLGLLLRLALVGSGLLDPSGLEVPLRLWLLLEMCGALLARRAAPRGPALRAWSAVVCCALVCSRSSPAMASLGWGWRFVQRGGRWGAALVALRLRGSARGDCLGAEVSSLWCAISGGFASTAGAAPGGSWSSATRRWRVCV